MRKELVLVALCLALGAMEVVLGSCSSTEMGGDIGPAGGSITVGNVTINVPPNALTKNEHLTITETGINPSGFVLTTHVFRFEPRNLVFQRPATVRFDGVTGAPTAAVVWSDSTEATFERLTTTRGDTFVSAPISHFSLGFVATGDGPEASSDAGEDGPTDATACGTPSSSALVATCNRRYADQGYQRGDGTLVDSKGNLLIVGTFDTQIDLGGKTLTSSGGFNVFIAKYDANCNLIWGHSLGGPNAVTRDEQMLYALPSDRLAVSFADNAMNVIQVIDSSGSTVWSKTIAPQPVGSINSITADLTGNLYVAGDFTGQLDFGLGPIQTAPNAWAPFIAKYDSTGKPVFSKAYAASDMGGSNGQRGLAVDTSGRIWMTGSFFKTVGFGGQLLVNHIDAMPLEPAGYFARVSAIDGSHISSIAYDHVSVLGVVADWCNGGTAVMGYATAAVDFGMGMLGQSGVEWFIAHFDATATLDWQRHFPTASWRDVHIDPAGNVIFNGTLYGPTDFGSGFVSPTTMSDLLLGSYGPSGGLRNVRHWPTTSSGPFGASSGPSGEVVATGILLNGTVDFGLGPLPSADGGNDAILVRFK
jgi:hypothetical protein